MEVLGEKKKGESGSWRKVKILRRAFRSAKSEVSWGMKLHSRSVLGDTTGELGAVSWHIGRNLPPGSVLWIHVAEPFESGNRLFAP